MSTLLASELAGANAQIARVTSNWYWFVLAGLVFLSGGLLAIANSFIASLTVETLMALFFIAGGVLHAIQLLRTNHRISFIWPLFLGILFISLGVVLLQNSLVGLSSLTLVIIALLAVSGLTKIIYAIKLKPLTGWIWMLISGLISLILAFLLMSNLAASAAITLGGLLAVELTSSGLWLLLIGFSFKRLHREVSA